MPEQITYRSEMHRLVAVTPLGEIYGSYVDTFELAWPRAFTLLNELARRAMYPEARVVSTIAEDVAGDDAFGALAYISGQLVGQMYRASSLELAGIAAMLAAHVQTGDSVGLEGLSATIANLLCGRVPFRIVEELATRAADINASSEFTLEYPYFVMERSGAIAAYEAGTQVIFDDSWRRKLAAAWRPIDSRLKELQKKDIDAFREALKGHGGAESLDQFGSWSDGWSSFAADDLGQVSSASKPKPGSYSPNIGQLGVIGHHAGSLSEIADEIEQGTWGLEPFIREDFSDPSEAVSQSTDGQKMAAHEAQHSINKGNLTKDVGQGLMGVAAVVLVGPAVPVAAAVFGGLAAYIYLGGGVQTYVGAEALNDAQNSLTMKDGGLASKVAKAASVAAEAAAKVNDKAAAEAAKKPQPIDPATLPDAPKPNTNPGSVDPTSEGHRPINAGLPILVSSVPSKLITKFAKAGFGVRPSDQNDTNRLTDASIQVTFSLVDPLRDPVDMLYADGSSKSTTLPPKFAVKRPKSWIYYSGIGLSSLIRQVGPDKVRFW